ncbi:dTMP kinase [Desulfuribacillus stibiiarsenatis]|uniref:Thymidylate kinase n=1 Tax=Desulfuribacillus stibiiarsenatis TaxID=1390249 RepID=A0A1E5L2N6_9FIRM|nr:dTMP kinase [Desulfuribacillus stibiiarsenatis]OEH84321.1 dTMP kinase [Desulfuribacillus stibiiarsenatis]
MKKGLFITFEGPEGGGKTTQVQRFIQKLRDAGHQVTQTREPGGTEISEKIRGILLDPDHHAMDHRTEMLLYAASRAQHVSQVIRPALEQGNIVVCDRFIDASIAYQGYGLGISVEDIIRINAMATENIAPDLTYLLDLPVELGMQRIGEKRGHNEDLQKVGLDRIESKAYAYHQKVRNGFLKIAEEQSERVVVIDATKDVETIEAAIWEHFRANHS